MQKGFPIIGVWEISLFVLERVFLFLHVYILIFLLWYFEAWASVPLIQMLILIFNMF